MTRMRTSLQATAAVALLSVLAGCAGDDPEPVSQPAGSSSTPAGDSSSATRPTQKPSVKPSDTGSPSQRDQPKVLIGIVGEADDPEAFTISLTDGSGKPVRRLEPGEYLVRVTDPASYHNFHLTGPGVDERTSVFGKSKVQWEVTLKSGEYTFVCDPHPEMVGDVVVGDGG